MLKHISIFMILSLLLCSTVPATEENVMVTQQQARLDAENDVARDANAWSWGVGGFFCNFCVVGASFAYTPTVPAANLIGKSPDYIIFYTEAYKSTMKKRNITAASIGCLAGVVVSILLLLSTSEE